MSDEIQIRTVDESELERFSEAIAVVFAFEPHADEIEVFTRQIETDRTMVAVDGGQFVATGGANSYRMVVPGGEQIGAGGLTIITVHPTHRRRGLLRRMIARHFDDAAQRREVVSILWASESSIYGRFGYGMGVEGRDLTVARAHARFRDDLPGPSGTVRLLDLEDARAVIPAIHHAASVGAGIPGSIERRDADWAAYFTDPEHRREGATRLHFAVHSLGEEPRGYARYRLKSSWGAGGPDGTVLVHDIQAVDGEAYASLWRYLFSIDLMSKVEASTRPVNDPLYGLVADPRRIEAAGYDALWVRVLDVEAALGTRRYPVEGSLVIEVEDRFRPPTGGRFRLEGGPAGARCVRTDDPPEVSIPVEHLGAAYLGAPKLRTLAWLGLVGGDDDAIALADQMFRWPVDPRISVHF